MGFKSDDNRTISFFTTLLDEHLSGHKVLNWGSKQSQEMRFKVLADIGISKGSKVLDAGCGLGDFYSWQKERGLNLNYLGIDITPQLIESAKRKYPGIPFNVANSREMASESKPFDFVIASGLFYLREYKPVAYLEETIIQLYSLSRKGLAFNSLSTWAEDHNKNEFYADPLKTLSFCKSITPYVSMRHDYHPSDFTIYMHNSPVL